MLIRNLMNPYSRFLFDADDGTASAAPAAVEDSPTEDDLDLESELTADTYDREYVSKLRSEAAARRTAAKELQAKYEAVYDGFDDPEDANYMLNLMRKTYEDPATTLADWERILNNIKAQAGFGEDDGESEEGEGLQEPKYLTEADLERREREKAVSEAEAQIIADATRLGYEPGSHQYKTLIHIALNDTDGDLEAAHAKISEELEAVGKAAVEEYIKRVQEGAEQFPPVSGGSASTSGPAGSSGGGRPKTFAEASESALARLNGMK